MIHNKFRYLLTLVALLAVTTGAWAQEQSETIATTDHTVEGTHFTISNDVKYVDSDGMKAHFDGITVTAKNGETITKVVISCTYSPENVNDGNTSVSSGTKEITNGGETITVTGVNASTFTFTCSNSDTQFGQFVVYYTEASASASAVEWNASTKTGTFAMPGSDVVLTPQYAPAAKWDVVETVEQKPAALEGIIAGQDEAIVTAGQSAQGTVMYAVTTSAEAAPALTAFSATVPTAKTYDDATTLYVWYYIQGQDTPDGQQATEENTFNDSEISATPLKVDILTNKFDLTLSPAPVKNMTVTVAGQAKTPTDEGKVEAVKMQSEVKLEAKPGYKFRKVEVKKKAVAPSLNITNPEVGQVIGSDGKNYAYASLPTGVTPVAKICYVSGSNGLALALTDEGAMNWSTAQTTCAAHTAPFTGGTWKLASQDEWNNMINAAGGYSALRDGFSSVGGTNMQSGLYWSSTGSDSNGAWDYDFEDGGWYSGAKGSGNYVRACIAF